ncbi:MAG: hypothetical protein P0111_09525 [Nitrospira sp.]|nr:hypothetical protein [Nitrospira sp.]
MSPSGVLASLRTHNEKESVDFLSRPAREGGHPLLDQDSMLPRYPKGEKADRITVV